MSKYTKYEKKLFKGDGGTEGRIKHWSVVHRPNLTRMSSSALEQWKNKVSRISSPASSSISSSDIEWRRVSHYIRSITKEIVINDRDLVRAIKKRRNIIGDISIEGVAIICNQSKGNELSIEYY